MSKLTDQLNARGIHNDHEFFGQNPYIGFRANRGGRDVLPSAWLVHKRGVKLSDAWYDYGAKSFSCSGVQGRKDALVEAQSYMTDKFCILEFSRSPFGGYGDSGFVQARIKEILALPEKK